MVNKVRVHGKAQNRTALGIANAYLVMYPHATLEDLNKAFPGSLNSANRAENLFVNIKDAGNYKNEKTGEKYWELFFFEKPDELIEFQNGEKAAMQELWQKGDFDKIVEHAKQYGIEVADFKPKDGFRKGGYTLEYLNGYVPPVPEKKKSKLWIWLLLALVVVIAIVSIILFINSNNKEPKIIEVEKIVTRVDTVRIIEIAEIEKNFNAAQFKVNSSELNEDAKFVLHDLAKLMSKESNLKLRIVGHTSDEGDAQHNQKLSEARAKAAVDFLVSQGINIDRLEYEGKGSSEPLDNNNRELNRRTEFIVIE